MEDAEKMDKVWEAFLNAKVVIWFCPNRNKDDHPDKDSVEWGTENGLMTPQCLICGTKGTPR